MGARALISTPVCVKFLFRSSVCQTNFGDVEWLAAVISDR